MARRRGCRLYRWSRVTSAVFAAACLCACSNLNLGCVFREEITLVGGTPDRLASAPPFVSVLHAALTPLGFEGPSGPSGEQAYFSLGVGGLFPKERIDVRYDPKSQRLWLIDYTLPGGTEPSKYDTRILDALKDKATSVYGAKLVVHPINEPICLG
jgi:hypothetical protein